jgi:hypothetical protein
MATLADYPHLLAQLDAKRNGRLASYTITHGSRRRLWWRCPEGPDHRWEASVVTRTVQGSGCPYCSNRAVSVTNALSKVSPALARQWHPTRNGDLRPRDVVAGSHRVVWWKCPKGADHEWTAKIVHRHRGLGCPFCAGKRPSRGHNFAVAFPAKAKEWHPIRNGELLPEDVTPGSNAMLWWRCSRGHEWSASAASRGQADSGCPFCQGDRVAPETSLAALRPHLVREWDAAKNGTLTPHDVVLSAKVRVWWKCPQGPDHEWVASVASRGYAGNGCPYCAGQRVSVTNSLAARFPAVAALWHPTRNGEITPHDVVSRSSYKAWWRCPSGHEWEAFVFSITRPGHGKKGTPPTLGCPYCANLYVSPTNSLAARFPKVAREWHPTRNGEVTPRDVVAGSSRPAWWRCAFGHEWRAKISARTAAGTGCRDCSRLGRKRKVAMTGTRRRPVRLAGYEGAHHGPVRRVK